ncbi:MAG: hypothetical protein DI589_21420 [Shinella sp.]|nr:MAG: hypothetical protein DI589_21420 [Shinella sp.]
MTECDLDYLEEMYTRMQEAGFTISKADFSQEFLGKGASYLTSMRARQRNVPEEVFHSFAQKLQTQMDEEAERIRVQENELQARMRLQGKRADFLRDIQRHLSASGEQDNAGRRQSRSYSLTHMLQIVLGLKRRDTAAS